jgi:hypothetical protein
MSYQQAPRFVEVIADVYAHRSADAHLHLLIAEIADLVSSARKGTGEPRRIRHRLYVVTADPAPGRTLSMDHDRWSTRCVRAMQTVHAPT